MELEKFGRLRIISKVGERAKTICDCGKVSTKLWSNIKAGRTKSCGCLEIENRIKHRMTNTRTYHSWENMIARTAHGTKQNAKYKKYYGKILVCKRWKVFKNFLIDMGKCPPGKTLDRINGKLGYNKKNCRWATRKEQQNNLKSNRFVNVKGRKIPIAVACELFSIKIQTFYYRKRKGFSDIKALKNPLRSRT